MYAVIQYTNGPNKGMSRCLELAADSTEESLRWAWNNLVSYRDLRQTAKLLHVAYTRDEALEKMK